jgi:putative intracellular protease/amidase
MICTSTQDWEGQKTGLWLEELAAPYYIFRDKGYQVIIASPLGGEIPIDGGSLTGDFYTPACKRFMEAGEKSGDALSDATKNNEDTLAKLTNSIQLADIDVHKEHIDAIFLCGGHGTCVDFVNNPVLTHLVETTYNAGKLVAAVCHGPNGLIDATAPRQDDTGDIIAGPNGPLVYGKIVTGFCNTEEHAVGCATKVPFLLETKLLDLGGQYEKAAAGDWASHVCVDGNLLTGQNPASSAPLAHAMTKILG